MIWNRWILGPGVGAALFTLGALGSIYFTFWYPVEDLGAAIRWTMPWSGYYAIVGGFGFNFVPTAYLRRNGLHVAAEGEFVVVPYEEVLDLRFARGPERTPFKVDNFLWRYLERRGTFLIVDLVDGDMLQVPVRATQVRFVGDKFREAVLVAKSQAQS